jgi:hypothetical protein
MEDYNFAKAREAWSNTHPWYTIDELNAWADKYQNEQWHKVAIRLGEELASVGPVGYYEMDASEWLDWAILKVRPRTWVGLTDEEVKHEWEVWRANIPRYAGFAKGIEAKLKEKNT